jgi:hypothetical protein
MDVIAPMFVLVLTLSAALVVSYFSGGKSTEAVAKKPCALHDWVTDPTEKLVCMECGYRPQTNQ